MSKTSGLTTASLSIRKYFAPKVYIMITYEIHKVPIDV